jgi:hypothetical protein
MSFRTRIGLVAAWVLSLLVAALIAHAHAQVLTQVAPVTPVVFSGNDVGFRVKGTRRETPVGTLVVRINGEWVEVDLGSPQLFQLR